MTGTTLVVLWLGLWQAVILLAQIPHPVVTRLISRTRLAFLFPIWQVYLGDGHATSYVLDRRDVRADGTVSAWMRVPLDTQDTGWMAICWAPLFWHDYTLRTIVARVVRQHARAGDDRGRLQRGFPYRALVQFVQAQPGPPAAAREFRITRRYGHLSSQPPEAVFVSERHER